MFWWNIWWSSSLKEGVRLKVAAGAERTPPVRRPARREARLLVIAFVVVGGRMPITDSRLRKCRSGRSSTTRSENAGLGGPLQPVPLHRHGTSIHPPPQASNTSQLYTTSLSLIDRESQARIKRFYRRDDSCSAFPQIMYPSNLNNQSRITHRSSARKSHAET